MSDFFFKSLNLRPEIGGNSYAVKLENELLILDAGMHPKEEGAEAIPRFRELSYDSADAILISHSHLDHIGTLPLLQREQPSAKVYMTEPCAALGEALLHNSVNVMTSQRDELGIPQYPLFHHREIDHFSPSWLHCKYDTHFRIDEFNDSSSSISFHDAGHILGSAGIKISKGTKSLFYTGDVNFHDQTLIKGASFPDITNIDLLIMETTRGSDGGALEVSRKNEETRFCSKILEALEQGGSALIPVFAIGKTQEVLTMIDNFKADGRIPYSTPVVIGGLSTKMTMIYDRFSNSTRRQRTDFKILRDMALQTGNRRKRRAPIEYQPNAIYCLSSGMMTEKTTSNIFARSFIQNHKNSLLFVGYTDPESPAAKIKEAQKGDLVHLDASHQIPIHCQVDSFNFSGHSPRKDLIDFAMKANPKQILLVHGDLESALSVKQTLEAKLPKSIIRIPEPLEEIPF